MQALSSEVRDARRSGMRGFAVIWVGQFLSMLGTGMTRFALVFWMWSITQEATPLTVLGFFMFAPGVIVSPIAGVLVDRWNRKLAMMVSDFAAGLSTIAILMLYSTGSLQIWHLYVAGAFASAFEAFQFPAYSSAMTVMLPKDQYARASGMLGLAESGSGIIAPALAGLLMTVIGVSGIFVLDILTFLIAIFTLLVVFVPQPPVTAEGQKARGTFQQEILYGFRYIRERPSLLGLQLAFFVFNFLTTLSFYVMTPMILARSGNSEIVLGVVRSAFGVGGVAGGLMLSVWGGPKRRIHGVLLGMIGIAVFSEMLMGLGRDVVVWSIAASVGLVFYSVMNTSSQSIWQTKVPPDVQGRVFAARRLIAQITSPAAILLAGPLADYVFEPAMRPDGVLAPLLSGLVGTGTGAGMALMFVTFGFLGIGVGLCGYLFPVIRTVEDRLPDHDVTSVQ